MSNALVTSATVKAKSKAAQQKQHIKHSKKMTKEQSENLKLKSALAGMKNRLAVKDKMPHVVHLPSHATVNASLKGLK